MGLTQGDYWVSGRFQHGADLRAACAQSGLLTVADAIELGAQIRAAVGA